MNVNKTSSSVDLDNGDVNASSPQRADELRNFDTVMESCGVTPANAKLLKRYFKQEHCRRLSAALAELKEKMPEKRDTTFSGEVQGMGYSPFMTNTEAMAHANAGFNAAIDYFTTVIEARINKERGSEIPRINKKNGEINDLKEGKK